MFRRIATVTVLLNVLSVPVDAEPKRVALVVGNSEYQTGPLKNPTHDADAVAEALAVHGFAVTKLKNLKKPDFEKAIDEVTSNLQKGDFCLIFFAGHGMQVDGQNYLVPIEAEISRPHHVRERCVTVSYLLSALSYSDCSLRVVVVDACRNNPFRGFQRSSEGLARLESAPEGTIVSFSTSPRTAALDGDGDNSPFAKHFVAAIRERAGSLEIVRLFREASRAVKLETGQTPYLEFDATMPDYFLHSDAAVSIAPPESADSEAAVEFDVPPMPEMTYRLRGQDSNSRIVVRSVVRLIEEQHYSGRKLNNEIARIWLDNYIETLDPQKLHFLQSDVNEFRRTLSDIDAQAREGEIGFAYRVFERYLTRFRDSQKMARTHIGHQHDFSVNEIYVQRPSFVLNDTERQEMWRQRIKLEILIRKNRGIPDNEVLHRVTRYLDQIARSVGQIEDADILDWCVTSLVSALDPHSDFYSPREMEDFRIQQQLRMVGIGARLEINDGYLTVREIIKGSPSDRDGRLKVSDRIVGVGQGTAQPVTDIEGLRLRDSVQLIRGKEGTVVRLKVLTEDDDRIRQYDLKRTQFALQQNRIRSTVLSRSRTDDGRTYKIGVIVVGQFYGTEGDTAATNSIIDTKNALAEFRREGVDAVALDFRSNSGGTLPQAINYSGLFLQRGTVVQTRGKNGTVQSYKPQDVTMAWEGPMVVITNRYTSSGAEIVVGALRDYQRALIIGDSTTNASGTAQTLIDIGQHLYKENPPGLGALRLTHMMFYLPNGESVQLRGIQPDITMASSFDLPVYGEVAYQNPLPYDRIAAVDVPRSHAIPRELAQELSDKSLVRRDGDDEFRKFRERRDEFQQRILTGTTPLNEEKYREVHQQQSESESSGPAPVVRQDAYLNEVIAIAMDLAAQREWLKYYTSGVKKLVLGDYAGAEVDLETGLRIAPGNRSLRLAKARAKAGSGDWIGALHEFRSAGREAVPARIRTKSQLKVESQVVRELLPGDRVLITNTNDKWVWAEFSEDRSQKGWIQKSTVVPVAD